MNQPAESKLIRTVEGRGVPLRGDDIDTDQIMPARFLKWITFRGIEKHLFEDVRVAFARDGHAHPLDDPRFRGGRILVVNRNFGCGSSREHAPQAIKRFGIGAIVGESFGEIFSGNCVAIGMPCVVAGTKVIQSLQGLCEAEPETELTLDLVSMQIRGANHAAPVDLSEGRRRQFLDGSWDSTTALLEAGTNIEAKLRQLPLPSSRSGSLTP